MEVLLRNRLSAWLTLVAASLTVPAAVLHAFVGEGAAPVTPQWHMAIMALGAGTAGAAAVALMVAGARHGDSRGVLVGGAFAAMAVLLTIHGLATPTVLTGPNGLVALTGAAALPVGGLLLVLATVPALQRPGHMRLLVAAEAALVVCVLLAGVAGLIDPASVPAVPSSGSVAAWLLLAGGTLVYGLLTWRAARGYALTRRRGDLAVLAGTAWLGLALFPVLILDPGTWSWWTGHALELAGIVAVGVPVALDLAGGQHAHPLAGDLPAAELVRREEAFLGAHVRALMRRLAEKDASTEEHTRRVALLAVQVGERMGLPSGRLRALALGGMLHDMGKLSVPDAVLRKPGALDEEELAIIRRHPVWGDELLADLGFSKAVRAMVRGHHERLDGAGYPDGAGAAELGLETRILTVCDVYDALVSVRVYRDAWPPERALALLHEESGSAFDPRCVAALHELLAEAGAVRALTAA